MSSVSSPFVELEGAAAVLKVSDPWVLPPTRNRKNERMEVRMKAAVVLQLIPREVGDPKDENNKEGRVEEISILLLLRPLLDLFINFS